MCGILGTFTTQATGGLDQRCNDALKALNHRGPDDRGLEIFAVEAGILALGHTRLSIIDLSSGGHQPMHSSDGRYTIVFNGEIYNYRELRDELCGYGHTFRSQSDTEVLLAAWAYWGMKCLSKLIGMFAFGIFDRCERTLTLVRDAFGIKPLFVCRHSDAFSFASEIPALLMLQTWRPVLDVQRAFDYLVWNCYDDQPQTFYKGIEHIPPGHACTVWLGTELRSEQQRWWWPSIEEHTGIGFDEAAEQLRELFLQNIRLHLRSDVPVGTALSGGLDSSSVVCAMRHLEPDMPIHTFTFVSRGSTVDEEHWADMVNEYVGAIVHKVVVSPVEMAADLDDMIQAQGEPFGGTSIYAQYRVFKLAREHGIVVTLDGQGGDELLAGYDGYPLARIASLFQRNEIGKLMELVWRWSRWPGRELRRAVYMALSQAMPEGLVSAMKGLRNYRSRQWLDLDFLASRGVKLRPPGMPTVASDASGRQLVNTLRDALTVSGLQSLLRHADRNAMRWSIESRVPFLTADIAEYVLTLPEPYLLSQSGETKSVFRSAMRGIVPDAILHRKDKIGFATPELDWLCGISNRALLAIEASDQIPFLRPSAIRHFVSSQIDGQVPFTFQSWRLINFCRWFELNNPAIG